MAKVHLMIGIQGSGKSTFSNQLSKKENIMIVSTDRVRQANPDWPEENIWPEVYRLCAELQGLFPLIRRGCWNGQPSYAEGTVILCLRIQCQGKF